MPPKKSRKRSSSKGGRKKKSKLSSSRARTNKSRSKDSKSIRKRRTSKNSKTSKPTKSKPKIDARKRKRSESGTDSSTASDRTVNYRTNATRTSPVKTRSRSAAERKIALETTSTASVLSTTSAPTKPSEATTDVDSSSGQGDAAEESSTAGERQSNAVIDNRPTTEHDHNSASRPRRLTVRDIPNLVDCVLPRMIDRVNDLFHSGMFDRGTLQQRIMMDQQRFEQPRVESSAHQSTSGRSTTTASSASGSRAKVNKDHATTDRRAVGRDSRSVSGDVPPTSSDAGKDVERENVTSDDEESANSPPSTSLEDDGGSNVCRHVFQQQVVVRQLLQELAERAVVLRTWIQQQAPAIVEGMNMGVAVHAMALRVTQEALEFTVQASMSIQVYKSGRKAVMSPGSQFPDTSGSLRFLSNYDERQFITMRHAVAEVLHHYVTLHRVIGENRSRIERPHGDPDQHLSQFQ